MRVRLWRVMASAAFAAAMALPNPVLAVPIAQDGASLTDRDVDAMMATAADVIDTRLSAMLQPGSRVTDNRASAKALLHSRAFDAIQAAVASEMHDRRTALTEVGVGYTDADTTLTLVEAKADGPHATLVVDQFSKVDYLKIAGDEPDFSSYEVRRTFSFDWDRSAWILTDIELAPDQDLPMDEPSGNTLAEMRKAIGPQPNPADPQQKVLTTPLSGTSLQSGDSPNVVDPGGGGGGRGGYNYAAMDAYATRYVYNYNPAYRSWTSGDGADCANFVSQSLRAGGWAYTRSDTNRSDYHYWWYGPYTQTYSWTSTTYLYNYGLSSGRFLLRLSDTGYLGLGDVLITDFGGDGQKDHTMIVTKTSLSAGAYVTYHTSNRLDRNVNELKSHYPSGQWFPMRT